MKKLLLILPFFFLVGCAQEPNLGLELKADTCSFEEPLSLVEHMELMEEVSKLDQRTFNDIIDLDQVYCLQAEEVQKKVIEGKVISSPKLDSALQKIKKEKQTFEEPKDIILKFK